MSLPKVQLGRTGLYATRVGLGSGYGTTASMVEEAVERGVNYLYWGALRSNKMAIGIRNVVRRSRDSVIIAVHSDTRRPSKLTGVVHDSIKQLGTEYLDVLVLGWHNKMPALRLLEQANELRRQGLVRFLALSGHHRPLFPELEKTKAVDIFHIRYNAVHRGAEREILAHMPDIDGPGIVTFLTTRWGSLLYPDNMPSGHAPPRARDCYRFVLTHPKVHVALCGPNSVEQLREDLKALDEGLMSDEEHSRMCKIGEHVYKNASSTKDHLKALWSIKWL